MDSDLGDLLSTLDLLDENLEIMVLKGWWTSQTCCEERFDRRFSNLDVWISPTCGVSTGFVARFLQPAGGPSASAYDAVLECDLAHNAGVRFASTGRGPQEPIRPKIQLT